MHIFYVNLTMQCHVSMFTSALIEWVLHYVCVSEFVQCNAFSLSFFHFICAIFKIFSFSFPPLFLFMCIFVTQNKKKTNANFQHAEASNQNSKSATIEMYAPSSYNDTVTGETLSSVSEKSDSYSNEGSQPDYMVSIFSISPSHLFFYYAFDCPQLKSTDR